MVNWLFWELVLDPESGSGFQKCFYPSDLKLITSYLFAVSGWTKDDTATDVPTSPGAVEQNSSPLSQSLSQSQERVPTQVNSNYYYKRQLSQIIICSLVLTCLAVAEALWLVTLVCFSSTLPFKWESRFQLFNFVCLVRRTLRLIVV